MPSDSKFSKRTLRSLGRSIFSKIDATLMEVAGYEYVDDDDDECAEDEEVDLSQPKENSDAQHELWRREFSSQELSRLARQEDYLNLRKSTRIQFKKRLKSLLAEEKTVQTDPIKRQATAPVPIPAPTPDVEPVVMEDQPAPDPANYQCPSAPLFKKTEGAVFFISEEELEAQKNAIQDTLDNFSIDAMVWDAIVGPRVTQLRLRPAPGVRVGAITALSKNLAMALSAESIRIQAPIPGKPYIGVEIPNGNSAPLFLGTLFQAEDWKNSTAHIPILLGMEIGGDVCILDLAAAPHVLIAGATGSGKSVCMNTLLMSLLCRFSPDELEMILVDPKRVEFSAYNDIPHLIRPVITEANMVLPALEWVIQEMQRRYKILATVSKRNLIDYNAHMDELGLKRMPFIVVVIDELADIMLTSGADVETALARIAQLSRAVGIHTVIATQRPSVNVITGTIKANYPTRIAFKVTSQIDSRSILDGKGAESLRGKGDMLYNPPGIGQLSRVQGPYVSDEEIETVVTYCSKQRAQNFKSSALELEPAPISARPDQEPIESDDPLLEQAIDAILGSHRASTSYLQRRLRIGYNRAANLIELLEERGVLGPQIGSTPREILIETYEKGTL